MTAKPNASGDDDPGWAGSALTSAALVAGLALTAVLRGAGRHPGRVGTAIALAAAIGWLGVMARARLRDRDAARHDPQGLGVAIGRVRGDWPLARAREFRLPWTCFTQHVLIDGPTGRGKTYTFIRPLLRAHIAREQTGVFYLDGKGDPIHHGDGDEAGFRFDHVVYPEDPEHSAHWNPLAGPDPQRAASLFAAALFPQTAASAATFYEARAVYVITRVATALAITGHGPRRERPSRAPTHAESRELAGRLTAAGVDPQHAERLVIRWAGRCREQLDSLPARGPVAPEQLVALIEGNARPPRCDPAPEPAGDEPANAEVTPATLAHAIFEPGELARLHSALTTARESTREASGPAALVAQLEAEIGALCRLPAREFAATLANLQNRLGHFLQPPFLDLCSRSDFTIADVCRGHSAAFLLPVGSFPTAAPALGRVALAQFKYAVLASGPGWTKVAILDEFHNFISPDWAAFLAQARSRGGAAVMALQSLAAIPADDRDALLANASTVILTPGCKPLDADYWSRALGTHQARRETRTYQSTGPLDGARRPSVRVEWREEPRFTPTQITELDPGTAIVHVTAGRRSYPAAIVDVERHG